VALNHYQTMMDKQLLAMGTQIQKIEKKDCAFFLWCSGPIMDKAIRLMIEWGFKYKTIAFNRVKTAVKDNARPVSIGPGSYTRLGSEFVLVGVRGKFASKVNKRTKPNQIVMAPRGAHSAKPEFVRDTIIDMIFEEQRETCIGLELFSRGASNANWAVWGDQTGKF
jgi:N6-adenosine-specific RNA methylase IME4